MCDLGDTHHFRKSPYFEKHEAGLWTSVDFRLCKTLEKPGWAWLTHPSGPVESQRFFLLPAQWKGTEFLEGQWCNNHNPLDPVMRVWFAATVASSAAQAQDVVISWFHVIFMQTEDQLEPMGSNNLYIFSTCTKKSRDSAAESHLIVHADQVRGLCSPWLKQLRRTRVSAADSAGSSKLVQHGSTPSQIHQLIEIPIDYLMSSLTEDSWLKNIILMIFYDNQESSVKDDGITS